MVTWEEVQRHNKIDDCWIVARGRVYDVTDYLPYHPAGESCTCAPATARACMRRQGGVGGAFLGVWPQSCCRELGEGVDRVGWVRAVILERAGTDVSDVYAYHSTRAREFYRIYEVARVKSVLQCALM